MIYHEHVILLYVSVYSSWVIRKPISQFDLFSSYFRLVSTLSILTIFLYICRYVRVGVVSVGGRIRWLTAAGHMCYVGRACAYV